MTEIKMPERETYVLRNGQFIPKRLAAPLNEKHSNGPAIHSDTMEPMKHMATGRIHDSKAKFRADTRAAGCVEVGNDPAALRVPPRVEPSMSEIVQDVKKSMAELNR